MDTLEKLQNETTYLVIDQKTNRFNFCGLAEIDEQVIADSVNGEEYNLNDDMPNDVENAIDTMTENYVNIADFTSVVKFVKDDTTYYYLTF